MFSSIKLYCSIGEILVMRISGCLFGRNVSADEMAHFYDGMPMEWLILRLALLLKQLLDEWYRRIVCAE